ncbi:hypothetical protein N9B94_02300, partial [Verrucomicrobia bacterium]|nr:hypothetical protein [Verrucomicrobiota bacterium]
VAFVAERVFKVEELIDYVDRHWPAEQEGVEGRRYETGIMVADPHIRFNIRYILGRRLMRLNRWKEAIPYMPKRYHNQCKRLGQSIDIGNDRTQPDELRAENLWRAAYILRYDGIVLIGAANEPDWLVGFVGSPFGIEARNREWDTDAPFSPSDDEIERIADSIILPNKRFHYRYTAAEVGWMAAKLMPDNSPETARVLCQSGTWLKNSDLQAADVFYKELVNRCRKTEMGQIADQLKWFPQIDRQGQLVRVEH